MALAQEVEVLVPLLASLPIGVMITDCNGVVRWANDRLCALTGYGVGEIVGQNAQLLESEDAAHAVLGIARKVVASGEPWTGESVGRRKNGELHSIEQTIAPIRDAGGRTTHLLWTAREPADRRVTDELRQCKEELDILNRDSPIPYQSLDAQGCLIAVNDAWLQGLGYSREEVIGHWFGEFLAPDQVELFRERFPKFKEGGRTRDVEFRMMKKDRGFIHASFYGNIGRDSAGQFRQTHCVWRDITERKRTEEALRKSEEQFAKAFRCSPAVAILTDLDGGDRLVDVNEAFEKVTGYRREEAIGRTTGELALWAEPGEYNDFARNFQANGGVRSFEYHFRRKNGGIGTGLISADPIELDGKRFAIAACIDTTEWKTSEEEKRHTERRYRSLFDSMQEGVAVHRLISSGGVPENYMLLDVNRRYEEILGVTRERVVNKLATDVYGTPDPPYLREYASVVETGKPIQFETYFSPMGKHFVISVAPMGDRHFATIFFDVTAQRQADERYKLVSENAADVIWLWDLQEHRCAYISPSVRQLRGFSPEEVMAQSMDQAMPPDAFQKINAELHSRVAALEAGDETARIRANETEFLRKDGTSVATETVTKLISDERRKVRHVLGVTRDFTQRKRAEEAIKRANETVANAERHYRRMFNSVSDAVFVHKLREDEGFGWFVEVNDVACRYLGYTREELLRLRPFDITPPERHSELAANMRRLMSEGQVICEDVHMAKDGRPTPVEINAHVFDLDDSPMVIACVRDISERKQAEAALRKSEDKFAVAFRSSPAVTMLFEVGAEENRIVDVNEAFERATGYCREEVIGRTSRELGLWADLRKLDATLEDFRAKGRIRNLEYELRRKDGGIFIGLLSSEAIEYDGKACAISTTIDITEQKKTQEAMRSLVTAIEQTDETIVITALDGTIQYCNPAFEKVTGYSKEEALGLNPRVLKSGKHGPEFYGHMWATITRGQVWTGRLTNKKKDGSLYEEEATISPIRNNSGAITGFVAIKRDVTERLQLEDQLRQAQKLESVGRLAGGVAHDFNNLLTVINGYSELLIEGMKAPNPLRGYAEAIGKAGERAASLTRQLLAFSRKQMIQPRRLDLNTTIRECAPMLQRLIGEDIVLETHLDSVVGQVMADPDQIHQVLMNLAGNARDAMPDGGKLDIQTMNVDLDAADGAALDPDRTPGRYVLMTVRDTGHGMDETTRQHIFEPFFTTKETGKGTGLGLSTVYGIVRQSGGWLDVSSALGVGTVFEVYLPHVGEGPVAETSVAGKPTTGGSETILVVEDQEAVRSFTKAALKQYGYRIVEASDGEQAVAIAGRYPAEIHLLLTDVVLPGMNGKELSGRLKGLLPNLKVLFTSGYPADVIAHRGVLDPGVAFLPKPFSPDELAAKVRDVLGNPSTPVV